MMMSNTPLPVGVNMKDMTVEQQILIENEMIRSLDSVLGNTNWKYGVWTGGYFQMDLTFTLDDEEEMKLTDLMLNRSTFAWSTMLSALMSHPNTQVLTWPHSDDVRQHLEDSSIPIPQAAVTWAELPHPEEK